MINRPLFDALLPTGKATHNRRAPRPGKPPTLPAIPKAEPARWTLTLEAMPGDVPPIIRLRRFLKNAKRAYRLRATVVECPPEPPESRTAVLAGRGEPAELQATPKAARSDGAIEKGGFMIFFG